MILIDIDGTLIKKQKEIDYDSWEVNPAIITFLQLRTSSSSSSIVFLTKRHEDFREQTKKMISDIFFRFSIDTDYKLIMRTCDGTETSGRIKWKLFQKYMLKISECVCIDDSKSVKEVFEEHGVKVIHPHTILQMFA